MDIPQQTFSCCGDISSKINNKDIITTSMTLIVNFEHISQLSLIFPLLTLNKLMFTGSPQEYMINFQPSA